jgi:hypothetical protein
MTRRPDQQITPARTGAGRSALASAEDACCVPTLVTPRRPTRARDGRLVLLLSWASLVWMTGEGAVGLAAGLRTEGVDSTDSDFGFQRMSSSVYMPPV